ncbi:hypothetical protein BT96DRAFT_967944 [Gymnopus androsaceus JB14]|uniref:Uncharacterized protein n=1 Tax=Gymnopus androsaceus JB14 TaxID=1447944 RepID=A0A6A4GV41_9AGAR|nr:hypothetical protein BT96DRAFT_967944 [Gymnopus androsaceus JB14]
MHEQALAMQKEGLLQDKDTRGKIHAKRCHDIMKAKSKELVKTYKCSTVPTTLIPAIAQSFLTLSTLNHPDPTFTLPVIVGLVTMANVESSTWFMNATEKEALRANEAKRAEMVAKSQDRWSMVKLNLVKNVKDSMRILSVLRIGLASIAPGAVVLYWVTSATFGLVQTWLVNWLDMRWRRKLVASTPPPTLATLQALTKTSARSAIHCTFWLCFCSCQSQSRLSKIDVGSESTKG